MINRKVVILFILLSIYGFTFSQPGAIRISVVPSYGDQVFSLKDASFKAIDSFNLSITELKFYISKIQFLKNGEVILEEKNSFHLVDASQSNSLQIIIENKELASFDQLKFYLGIDSTTNVSGVLGGDLDPTKGMYWAWQSGYINFKLEGNSPKCKTRNNEFQFHLGGYEKPNDCLQTLSFAITNTSYINLKVDVKKFLQQIDVSKTNHIMSPSPEAVILSKIVANAFTISQN
jgi:hypothetical protein